MCSGERVEDAVAEHGENPAFGQQHTLFDLRLVPGMVRARRQDHGAVVLRELGVGRVEVGVVVVGACDADLRVVGDQGGGDAAPVRQGVHVRADPGGEVLAEDGLRVGEVARPEDREEERRRRRLARLQIDDGEAPAAEVDEPLLARPVHLPHREREARRPDRVARAELAVLVPLGGLLAILLPEELLGHVRTAQLPMDRRPVGLRPGADRVVLVGEEQPLEHGVVVERRRQRPAELRHGDPPQVAAHRAPREPATLGDRSPRQAAGQSEPNHFPQFAHGDPLCRHQPPPWWR